jgi:MFS family permease
VTGTGRALLAMIAGQLGVHAALGGLRMATPLQALGEGYSPWAVGVLLALFAAAPVVLALHAGRMADRLGYRHPMQVAVALVVAGALVAVVSTADDGWLHFALLCLSALLVGAGANIGMIATQRAAGHLAGTGVERVRVFSWLGIAPSFANVVGPVSAGLMIDAGGFRAAYLLMLALPLMGLWFARRVPAGPVVVAPSAATGEAATAWHLLREPGMKRLLFVNWLLSTCWDVHNFAVPILGHERGFSASTIGLILGAFTLSVSLVRLVIPLLAQHLREVTVVRAAMVGTALVFVLYPLAPTPLAMMGCALLLGISLGVVQPMLMSTLFQLTPTHRHGEALAFRSMSINASSTAMPLLFGLLGTTLGAAALFWLIGAAVGAGNWSARRLQDALTRAGNQVDSTAGPRSG